MTYRRLLNFVQQHGLLRMLGPAGADQFTGGTPMQIAVRRYVATCSALLLAGAIAVAPLPPRVSELHVISLPTRLVDAESILHVPLNLFYDLINIPRNELNAIQELSDALFFVVCPERNERVGFRRGDPPKA